MRRMAGLWAALLLVLALTPVQAGAVELPIQAEAALLMEKETGQVLYAKNEHQALEPASVTKVMTLLLTFEALDAGAITLELGAGRYYQQPEEHLERGLRVLETAFGQKLGPRPSSKA